MPNPLDGIHFLQMALEVELVDCGLTLLEEEPGKVGLVMLEVPLDPRKVEDEAKPVTDAVTVAGVCSR